MERNSCETAFRCLEVAVHPNTGDREALAAIAGYRRTAGGASLADLCLQFAHGAEVLGAEQRVERLGRENRALRRELGRAKAAEGAAHRRAEAAERRACDLDAELHAARQRADAAAGRLAEAAIAHAEVTAGLRRAIVGLRGALSDARHSPAVPSFRDVLAAARDGSAAPAGGRYTTRSAHLPLSGSPWTA